MEITTDNDLVEVTRSTMAVRTIIIDRIIELYENNYKYTNKPPAYPGNEILLREYIDEHDMHGQPLDFDLSICTEYHEDMMKITSITEATTELIDYMISANVTMLEYVIGLSGTPEETQTSHNIRRLTADLLIGYNSPLRFAAEEILSDDVDSINNRRRVDSDDDKLDLSTYEIEDTLEELFQDVVPMSQEEMDEMKTPFNERVSSSTSSSGGGGSSVTTSDVLIGLGLIALGGALTYGATRYFGADNETIIIDDISGDNIIMH